MISFSNTAGIVTHHTHALETKPKPKPIAEKEVYEFVDGGVAETAKKSRDQVRLATDTVGDWSSVDERFPSVFISNFSVNL